MPAGLFTGHRRLDSHKFNLKLAEEAVRRFHLVEEQTSNGKRPARMRGAARPTFLPLGEKHPTVNSDTAVPLKKGRAGRGALSLHRYIDHSIYLI